MRAPRRFGAVLAAVLLPLAAAVASPPACDHSNASRFRAADAVAAAEVTSSRRWAEGGTTLHLVAKYELREVFKGALAPGETVIVTDTCLDAPVPEEMLGYPAVERYCLGGLNLSLTGVDAGDGTALPVAEDADGWILFLRTDDRRGAPELTWTEVEAVGYGGDCDVTPAELTPVERAGYERMTKRHPAGPADGCILGICPQ